MDFKILLWENRCVKQIEKETERGINEKMKKSANKSKLALPKLDKIKNSRWEIWNGMVFEWGGHWSNF